MSNAPVQRRRARMSFDNPADKGPEETPEQTRQRQADEAYARYREANKDDHDKINAELVRSGQPPLAFVDPTEAVRGPDAEQGTEIRHSEPSRGRRPPVKSEVPAADPARELNPHLPKVELEDVTVLPSRGMPYPPGSRIRYRGYMLGEIEEFENSTLSTKERYLLILRGIECNFDKLDMTLSDVMYVGLLRRLSTLGVEDEFGMDCACPACGGMNTIKIKVDEIQFKDLEIPALPARVRLSIGEHQFYPCTIGDYLTLLDYGYKTDLIGMLAITCHTLDFPESIETFRTITSARDQELLKRLDTLFYHGVAPARITCVHHTTVDGEVVPCGQSYPVALENAAEGYIYPFRRQGDPGEDEISFG